MKPPAEAEVGASAMALREAAATRARVNLRSIVVLLELCAFDVFVLARVKFQSYPSPIRRALRDAGSSKRRRVLRQFSERLFRCEKRHIRFEPLFLKRFQAPALCSSLTSAGN